ncbi:Rec8 like protein-domain-containing protein [Colletotrichum navitas]|uniref:Rec8 like protein-domain-containing protein n=1 Tax=Colletotrichum navitas TaxID=681940 RepID=A0AAD8PQ42_9PEZI|nr:Rec8 like protein-domain-containing protein [Colletotrichum navitas]KAK1574344.1 Rec8 like protein-domain-containing protein [Colletotrichum navitas]
MFYSHEILNSRQFGVATIWVVATVGPRGGGKRKISRKAIEEVDIRKACEKIIEPGAPISLRLQSNLLFGVSRVYSSKCNYMLNDAEKVQTLMKTFFRLIANNETVPNAGRARRDQITLGDDPGFIPTSVIPHFTIDDDGNPCFISGSRSSSGEKNKSQSQLSPFPDPIDFTGGRENSVLHLDISQSFEAFNYPLPSPFARSSSAQNTFLPRNREDLELDMNADPFDAMNDLENFGGVELEIDENGAVIVDEDDLELPALERANMGYAEELPQNEANPNQQPIVHDSEGNVPMMGSDPIFQPEDDALQLSESPKGDQRDQAAAPSRKRRRVMKLDNEGTTISRTVLKSWQEQYVENAERATRKRKGVTQSQARSNAYFLTLGQGIGGIGRSTGIPGTDFPLADIFAGSGLRDIIYGPPSAPQEDVQTPSPQGRRRRANEAFGEAGSGSEDRNVRPRVDETPRPGGSMDDDGGAFDMMFGEETMPEMGMEAAQPMDEHQSSSMMPWNRTPSVGRASSVISHSARRHEQVNRQKSTSIRGSSIPPFEPLHSAPGSDWGIASVDKLGSQNPRPEDSNPAGFAANAEQEGNSDSQWMRSTLDTASEEFLQWVEEEAKKTGQVKVGDDKENRRWVEFEELIEPAKQNHVVAAQAFHHVLSLATKNAISVEQQVDNMQPFGPIRIGLDMTAHLENQEE